MSSISSQGPRSATSIYSGIVAAATTIVVSIILFRKLRETGDKSRNRGISKKGHPQTLQPQSIDQDVRDEHKLDISIPVQLSTTLLPEPVDHSAGGEGLLGISVPSHAPSTTSKLRIINQDAKDEHISIPTQESNTPGLQPVDFSDGDEGQLGILAPSQALPTTSEAQFIDKNKSISIPAQTSTASEPHGETNGVPSITLFQGSLNFQISETNASVLRNGDGRFTRVQRNLACEYIANLHVALPDINDDLKKHALTQSIIALRAEPVPNDYQNNKSGPCFKGTRVALLREMADCVTGSSESRMYILSGLAGTGKSTVAYTIASRAADLNLLGASFVFSRDDADCNNAKNFFTTIAYQLCVYNETFSKAIGDALETEDRSVATTEEDGSVASTEEDGSVASTEEDGSVASTEEDGPVATRETPWGTGDESVATLEDLHQLQSLILDPLRSIVQSRPILIVIDALDECDETDALAVLTGLSQLVRNLPSFKILLTTRPQPYLNRFLISQTRDDYPFFYLQDIEDKDVDSDIRLYLAHNLSMKQVQKYYPMQQWYASDEEIDSLVCAAGNFFFIASMAVRYILDKTASNPAAQMQALLLDYTPFKDLDRFYTVIIRNIVPENSGDDDIVSRYQSVVGTILSVQHPLPVSALAHLIGIDVEEIRAVLDKLQSVILLGDDDVPRVCHESFSEYLTDQSRCKDLRLRIDPGARTRHTQIATHCFTIMNKYLKHNILGLGDPARFMSNEDGLKEDGITYQQIQENIPQQLRYACVYWVNHLEVANIEDEGLVNGLKTFVHEHMLHWFEILSLIGKLDLAGFAILKLLNSHSHQLLSDALRFINRFYEIIKRSALHTYYSALLFAPTDSLLYRQYIKEAENIYATEGGLEKWGALVARLRHRQRVQDIGFSPDNTLLFSSCYEDYVDEDKCNGKLKIWDTATCTPISMVSGDRFAVANDFSVIASSNGNTAALYNLNGTPSGTNFNTPSRIQKLALSSESNRVAAALSDGTVLLWNSRNAELIDSLYGFKDSIDSTRLEFSPTGKRLAYSSAKGIIKLRDGISGRFIADLEGGSSYEFEFSADGSRIASVSYCLTVWNSENGGLISRVVGPGYGGLAFSANGSLIATKAEKQVMLRSDSLVQIKVLEVDEPNSMTFSLNSILAIGTRTSIKLYNVKTHSFIHTLSVNGHYGSVLAFSPDCTYFAASSDDMCLNLWNIRGIDASSPPSKDPTPVSAVVLSRDCSRLACGFEDGTIELWETSPTKRLIAYHEAHTKSVGLVFGSDGGLFASGGEGESSIKLWNGRDGSLHGTLEGPRQLESVALSNSVLVAAGDGEVTLWSLDTLSLIHTFDESRYRPKSRRRTESSYQMEFNYQTHAVSITENNALIAVAHGRSVSLLDAMNHRTITTFNIDDQIHVDDQIHTMTFLPDNLHLVAQSCNDTFISFNLTNKHVTKGPTLEHLIQLPNVSLWRGVPIWHCPDRDWKHHYFAALFSQHKSPVPMLWIPSCIDVRACTQGSSMIALGCLDGRVILLRLPSHVG